MKSKIILFLLALFTAAIPSCTFVPEGGYSGGPQQLRRPGGPPPGYYGQQRRPQPQYYSRPQQNPHPYDGGYNPEYRDRNQSNSIMFNPPGRNAMGWEEYNARVNGGR